MNALNAAKRVAHGIKLEEDVCSFSGHTIAVGPRGRAILAAVVAAGGSTPVENLVMCGWGEGREVSRNLMSVTIHRINERLADCDCPARLTLEGASVCIV